MRITKAPEARRQEIIDAARTCFEEQGIDRTSMNGIAETVGVAKGLVYYYFSSKDELAEAVVNQLIAGLDEELQSALDRDDLSFHDKLSAILNVYFQTIQSHPTILAYRPSRPGMSSLIRDRLSGIAFAHASQLLLTARRQQLVRIEYPEYMLKILIRGLGDLYIEGIHEPQVHATLIEQTLGLERGRLELGGASRP